MQFLTIRVPGVLAVGFTGWLDRIGRIADPWLGVRRV
jgi:hypothetical protein